MSDAIQKTRRKGLYIDDPTIKKVIGNLVKDPEVRSKSTLDLNKAAYENKTDQITASINDSHSLRQMLPDLELAKHIIVSSILSPHDLQTAQLTFSVAKPFDTHPLAGELIRAIESHFTSDYKIQEELSEILEEALFETGASIRAILPESELTRIINSNTSVAQESVSLHLTNTFKPKRSLGVLGNAIKRENATPTMESYFTTGSPPSLIETDVEKIMRLSVTDNPDTLLVPMVQKKLRNQNLLHRYGTQRHRASLEAKKEKRLSAEEVKSPHRFYDPEHLVTLSDPGMINVDNDDLATVMKLPMEATIPVHTPGDPSNHIGYWVVLDENGHPIKKARTTNYYVMMQTQLKSKSQVSELIQKTARAWYGVDQFNNDSDPAAAAKVYSHLIEKELITRLKNGVYQNGIDITMREEVSRLMLSRALSQKGTQLLFMPAEFVSYFAFHYDEEGIGQSLIEATKIVGSIRAMLMFSGTMGLMRNSIGRTMLEIEFDGDEPDPEKLREYVIQEYLNSRSPFFPIGEPNPVNIVDYIRRAGVEVKTSGHPDLPNTKVNIDNFNSNISMPESDLEEQMKNRQYLGLGLSPDLMDQASSLDLATSVVRRDLLLSKRVLNYQTQYCTKLTRHLRIYTHYSGALLDRLTSIVSENRKKNSEVEQFKELSDEELVGLFVSCFEVNLPKPDTSTVENQSEALSAQSSMIEDALEWYMSGDMFTSDDMKELEYLIPNIKAQIKALYMRRYMRSNNILTELEDMVTFDQTEERVPLMDELKSHAESVSKGLFDYLLEMDKLERNRVKKMEAIEEKIRLKEEEEERKRQEEEDALNAGDAEPEEEGGGGAGEDIPEEEEGGTGDEELPGEDEGGDIEPEEEEGGETPPEEDDLET